MTQSLSANNSGPIKVKKVSNKAQDIIDIIQETLHAKITDTSKKKYGEECVNALIATTGEFLDSFIILGYDFNGMPYTLTKVNNQQDADALAHAVQRFIKTH
jgi:hypothetical protein